MIQEFFTSGEKGCYNLPLDLYFQNEALFFKMIYNTVHNNKEQKEKWKKVQKRNQDSTSLEDYGIKPMLFNDTLEGVFGDKPKDHLKEFFKNDVI